MTTFGVGVRRPSYRGASRARPETRTIEYRLLTWTVWITLAGLIYREVTATPTVMFIGSYNFTVVEPAFGVAVAAFLANARKYGLKTNLVSILIYVMTLIWLVNLFLGMRSTPTTAFLSMRISGLFAVYLLIATVRHNSPGLIKSFERVALGFCGLLAILVALRLAFGVTLFAQDTEQFGNFGFNDGSRPISTSGAFMLSIYAAYFLANILRQNILKVGLHHLGLILALFAIMGSGQGTSSAAAVVGLLVVLLFQKGQVLAIRLVLIIGISVATLFSSVTLPALNDNAWWSSVLPQSISQNLGRREGNLHTRQVVWAGIMETYRGADLQRQLIGWPAGNSPRVMLADANSGLMSEWKGGAHSMYFGTLISHGAIGVACYVIILLSRALELISANLFRGRTRQNRSEFLAYIAMVATYSYSYDVRNEGAMVFMIALIGVPFVTMALKKPIRPGGDNRVGSEAGPPPARFPGYPRPDGVS